VEGIVDVDELWARDEWTGDADLKLGISLPPSAEKGSIL